MNNTWSGSVVRAALDGLAARQRVIAHNIANLQTPGFTAQRVLFEDALSAAVSDREAARIGGMAPGRALPDRLPADSGIVTTADSLEPTRTDGNNVNLDRETLLSIETNLRYRLMLRAAEGGFSLVRESIRTQ